MIILPRPYPDELLHSVIARYLCYGQGESPQRGNAHRLTDALFGRPCRPRLDLPRFLDNVAAQTSSYWGLTAEQIAQRHTLLPYLAYASESQIRKRCLAALCSSSRNLIGPIQNLKAWRIPFNIYLRQCVDCRNEDISIYGEAYWRRAHQLPGSLVCHRHGVWLRNTDAMYAPYLRSRYDDATVAKLTDSCVDGRSLRYQRELLWRIARRNTEILWQQNPAWTEMGLVKEYRSHLTQSGMARKNGSLDLVKIKNKFADMYPSSVLEALKIDRRGIDNGLWVGSPFRKSHLRFHPLEHALIQIFLETQDVCADPYSNLRKRWKCPNTQFVHKTSYPLSKIRYFKDANSQIYAAASCTCGFRFSFYQAGEIAEVPLIKRLSHAEKSWVEAILKLASDGKSIEAISKEHFISPHQVKRILKNPHSWYEEVDAAKLEKWKARWGKLRRKYGAPYCRVNYYELYRKIEQYAPEMFLEEYKSTWKAGDWKVPENIGDLLRHKKPGKRGRRQGPRVDWNKRDSTWCLELKRAVKVLRSSPPLVPISRVQVVRTAGLKDSLMNELEKLPRCKAILEGGFESEDEYLVRKLRYHAKQLRETGSPLLPSILKRKANIVGHTLSGAALDEFESLTTVRQK